MDLESTPQFFDASWEAFLNDSGEEIPAFACMRINGINTTRGRACYAMRKPDTFGSIWGHRMNGPNPVAAGAFGLCVLGGVVAGLYDTTDGTPAHGEHWGPRDGSWKLRKNTSGWRVLANSTDSGIAYVQHWPSQTLLGKTDAAILKGNTGVISVYWGSTGATVADTGENVNGYLRYGNVAINKFVTLNWNGWSWEIIAAECGE